MTARQAACGQIARAVRFSGNRQRRRQYESVSARVAELQSHTALSVRYRVVTFRCRERCREVIVESEDDGIDGR